MKIKLCSVDDFKENNILEVNHNDRSYLVAKVDNEFYVIDNMCSHEDSELTLGCLEGHKVKCSLHGSYFDLKTGMPLNEPASESIKTYKIKIEKKQIYIDE